MNPIRIIVIFYAICLRTQKIEKRLTDEFTKTEGVSALWSKISDLEKVLDPNYLSNLKLSDSAKSELLVGYAEQLKDLSKPIEELQQLKDYSNHAEFQGLEDHEKRLTNVARSHAHQEQQVAELSQQVHQLLSAYSKIMLQLSAQFIEWGEVTKNKAN